MPASGMIRVAALFAAQQRRNEERERAAIAERRRIQASQWGAEIEPKASAHDNEVKALRIAVAQLQKQVAILMIERNLARGRPLYWG